MVLLNSWASELVVEGSSKLESINLDEIIMIKHAIWETAYSFILIDVKKDQFEMIEEKCTDLLWLFFQELANEGNSYSIAAQWISEILVLWSKFGNTSLSTFMKNNLLLLEDKCQRICDQEDIDSIETYASMYADLADCEMSSISNGENLQILKICLLFYSFEGKHFKQINNLFWYFLDYLMNHKKDIRNFTEFFELLINAIEAKSKIDTEMFIEFETKIEGHPDFDEFYQFRNYLGKLLKRIGLCFGHHEMYFFWYNKLKALIDRSGDWSDINSVIELENLLFIISYWVQLINSHQEIDTFQEWISLSLNITSKGTINEQEGNSIKIDYAALRRTVIDILHVMSEFYKDMNQESLHQILSYIVEGFSNKMTRDISCQCFDRVIIQNMDWFKESLQDLILYLKDFAQEWTSYNPLWAKSFNCVLSLACNMYKDSQDFFKEAFERLLMPFVEKIGDVKCTLKEAAMSFEFIADMFVTIGFEMKAYPNIKDPSLETFISIWPLIFQYVDNHSDNEKVVESNTRLVKKVFRILSDKSGRLDSIAQQYIDKVISNFQAQTVGWLIYPIEVMIPLYIDNENFRDAFCEVTKILISRTLEYIDSVEMMKKEAFLLTDLFSWMNVLINESPETMFTWELFKNLYSCSILEINGQESTDPEIAKILWDILNSEDCLSRKIRNFQSEVYCMIKDLKVGRRKMVIPNEEIADVVDYVFSKGEAMFERFIQILVQVPMGYVQECLIDLMWTIVIEFPEQSIPWLQKAINEHVPDDWLSESEKKDFCVDFQYGSDSMYLIHKSFGTMVKRCKKCIVRGFV